jgi:RNA polymerase sigma-70 factor (ECF subfamily)
MDSREHSELRTDPAGGARRPAVITTPRSTGLPSGPGEPSDAQSDVDLVARLDAGDPHAMPLLYGRYSRPAYSLARRICGDQDLAEDVIQEVFLALWRQPSGYRSTRGTFRTWLLTVVHHKAVDAVRRRHTAHRLSVPSAEAGEDCSLPHDPGADTAALESVFAGQVRAALQQLPVPQRHTLLLAYYGGYTHREISTLLGIPLGTVKSRISVGVRRLRILLSPLATHTATAQHRRSSAAPRDADSAVWACAPSLHEVRQEHLKSPRTRDHPDGWRHRPTPEVGVRSHSAGRSRPPRRIHG